MRSGNVSRKKREWPKKKLGKKKRSGRGKRRRRRSNLFPFHHHSGPNQFTQAKREQAKKDGTLLTKKQKEEKAAAERRRQALLASGVQIEGLQAGANAAPSAKKVVYGNRKKKGPGVTVSTSAQASPAPISRPLSPEATPEPSPAPTPAAKIDKLPASEDVKSDWDASSDDEAKAPVDTEVKDSWDATSEEENISTPASKPVQKGIFADQRDAVDTQHQYYSKRKHSASTN